MSHYSDGVRIGRRKTRRRWPYAGVGVYSSLAILDFVPATLDRDGICLSQVRTGAGDLTIAGAFATSGVATLDASVNSYGRCVGLYSAGDLSLISTTIYGYDCYGSPLVETIPTGPSNTTVSGVKAFGRVTRVAVSATLGTAMEVGTVDKFGLPMCLGNLSQVVRIGWNATLAANAATFAVAVTTSPATAITGDVRGTVIGAGAAADGARRLTIVFVPDLTSDATQFGVTQFGTGVET
jgi:hypothetical protein